MSAISADLQDLSTPKTWAISFRCLFSLYSIIPCCIIVQLLDIFWWQGYLKHHLPSSPSHFLLFQILFGTPHIIASAIILASNSDYRQRYRRPILLMTTLLALVFGVGSLFIPYKALYIATAAWTVFHVLKQQHGIVRGISRLPAWAYYLLLWLSVMAGFFIYIGIFLKNSLEPQQVEWLTHIAGSLCVGLICTALLCQRYINNRFGKWFMWANVFLVVSSFYFYNQQYYFLAILVPRLVHDVTAYIFYVTHDYNKHHAKPENIIYRFAAFCRVPIVFVLPFLSFSLAFLLQAYGDQIINGLINEWFEVNIHKVITVGLLGYLALMHYFTEAFTWKHDSPYRQFIAFSK